MFMDVYSGVMAVISECGLHARTIAARRAGQHLISAGFCQLIAALRAAGFAYIRCMSATMAIQAQRTGGNRRCCTSRARDARRRFPVRGSSRCFAHANASRGISAAGGKICRFTPHQASKCTRFPPLIRTLPKPAAHNMAGMLDAHTDLQLHAQIRHD